MSITESKKIKENIDVLSAEEFDKVLYDCGIESIKPSIESKYVECLIEANNADESVEAIALTSLKGELYYGD